MTGASIFSGFGAADLGMSAAGIEMLWGIELEDDIAEVARMNGLPIHTADVTTADPSQYERVDCLHASPVCKSFSAAKTDAKELQVDIDAAEATARFIEHIRPEIFTLENVWQYRGSVSWSIIYKCLMRLGYGVGHAKLCAADYGVPQTRERMIVWALKDGRILSPPTPTHAENPPEPGLFGDVLPKWIGWYGAIEDLIPGLPESELAPWQLKRLPEELRTLLIMTGNTSDQQAAPGVGCCYADEPSNSVYTMQGGGMPRAVLIDGDNAAKEGPICRGHDNPSPTISQSTKPRAVLISGDTVEGKDVATRDGNDRAITTKPNGDRVRAVLVDGQKSGEGKISEGECGLTIRSAGEPSHTVTASVYPRRPQRAIVGIRTVQMTPHCLARFQSFPDSYWLPDNRKLACTGIGNAVPKLLQQRLYEHLIRQIA